MSLASHLISDCVGDILVVLLCSRFSVSWVCLTIFFCYIPVRSLTRSDSFMAFIQPKASPQTSTKYAAALLRTFPMFILRSRIRSSHTIVFIT